MMEKKEFLWEKMETERLNIRRFQQLDCNDLHDILGDAILMEFTEPPFSLSQTRDFLENFCIRRTPQVAFAVELKATQKVIGYLLLKPLDHKGTFELGFWINRDFWRTGIAFEACQCLIAHAFLNRSAQKIVAETCDVKKAVPLLKKLGLRMDHVILSAMTDNHGQKRDTYWLSLEK